MSNRIIIAALFILTSILPAGFLSALDDLASMQVEIEARIVVTNRNFVRDLGIFQFNGEGATALAKKNDQEVWFFGLNLSDHQVYRAPLIVEPQFQAVLSELEKFDQSKVLQTPKVQTATNSQSTIVMTPEIKFIEAVQVDANGFKKGGDFRISSITTNLLTGGISSDGRASVISTQKAPELSEIQIFMLNSRSRRKPGGPIIFVTPTIIGAADISDPLIDDLRTKASRRFLVYRAFRTVGADVQSALFLQVIDGDTGELIGSPKVLRSFKKTEQPAGEFFQSVAIDPDGEYVLYTAYKGSCGKLLLYRQPLNADGTPAGRARVGLGCSKVKNSTVGVTGLDILDRD